MVRGVTPAASRVGPSKTRAHASYVLAMALGYDMTRPALLLQAFIRHGG